MYSLFLLILVADLIQVWFEYSEVLWPYTGWLAVYVTVGADALSATGTATGEITLEIASPPMVCVAVCCVYAVDVCAST